MRLDGQADHCVSMDAKTRIPESTSACYRVINQDQTQEPKHQWSIPGLCQEDQIGEMGEAQF